MTTGGNSRKVSYVSNSNNRKFLRAGIEMAEA
jgi:hypothetical protein